MPKDLLYKPSLGYEKNYYTEGGIQDNTSSISTLDESISLDLSRTDVVDSLRSTVEDKIKFLPYDIKKAYLTPFKVMEKEYVKLKNEIEKLIKEEITEELENIEEDPSNINNEENEDDDFPEDFRADYDVYIDIVDPRGDKVEYIRKKYINDFLEIYSDYLTNTANSADNYIYSFFEGLNKVSEINPNLSYNSSNVNNKDLLHLTDFNVKSDIIVDQRVRLHRKMFDIDESMLHIRQLKISKAEVERYEAIDILEDNVSLLKESNLLLKETVKVANIKYDNALVALYKYLNSSNDQMDETLKILTKKNKSIMAINYKKN